MAEYLTVDEALAAVLVEIEGKEGDWIEVEREQIEPLEELEALEKKAAAGCSKQEGGGCTCGANRGHQAEPIVEDTLPQDFLDEIHPAEEG